MVEQSGIFVEASSEANRVLKPKAKYFTFKCWFFDAVKKIGEASKYGETEAQEAEAKVVNPFGVEKKE